MNEFTNCTFSEIEIGTTAKFPHRLTRMDVDALALVSGEIDPFHVDADGQPQQEIAAEAVAAEALVSAMLKRRMPGPGTTIISQELRFSGRVAAGDELVGIVTARGKNEEDKLVIFDCRVSRGDEDIVSGTVTVAAPTRRISYSELADTARTRLTSAAVMKLVAQAKRCAVGSELEVAHA
jgi:acyl dehydratase